MYLKASMDIAAPNDNHRPKNKKIFSLKKTTDNNQKMAIRKNYLPKKP